MTDTRRRLWPRSLTARLVSFVVALVVLVLVAGSGGTYFALRSFLYQRLDQQVRTALNQNLESLGTESAPAGQPSSPLTLWLIVLDPNGTPAGHLAESTGVKVLQLSAGQRTALASAVGHGSPDLHTVTTVDDRQLRIGGQLRTLPGGQPVILVVGLSTNEIEHTLGHLVTLELLIGGGAILVALLASFYGVRFGLRGLYRVTRTARDVAAELSPEGAGLDRRVQVTESGTEVGQLADSMNTLLAAVETQFAARLDSEQRMRRFLADASHELRTPLTSIRGYAELARMQRTVDAAGHDDAAVADNLSRIESEGTRMSRLVDDLLMLARGDQGSLPEHEPIDVDELIADVAASSRAAFPDRTILEPPPAGLTVVGDHDQLLRAIRNLVNNAASYTRPDGSITLRAFGSGPGVAIEVVDQGPGLPPEEAAHVFERFWRADKARSRARGGSGLGLAIVASIAAMHNGTVYFRSTVPDGSTVTLWLPLRSGEPTFGTIEQ